MQNSIWISKAHWHLYELPCVKVQQLYVYPTERASASCLTTYRNYFPKRHQFIFITKTEHVLCEVWCEFIYIVYAYFRQCHGLHRGDSAVFPRPVLVGFLVNNVALGQDFSPSTSVFLCQCHSNVALYSSIYHGHHPHPQSILTVRCVVDWTHRSWG